MDMEKIADSHTLHNGVKIPGLGFGVWQISPLHTAKCVKMAIKAGYETREIHVDKEGMDIYGVVHIPSGTEGKCPQSLCPMNWVRLWTG